MIAERLGVTLPELLDFWAGCGEEREGGQTDFAAIGTFKAPSLAGKGLRATGGTA